MIKKEYIKKLVKNGIVESNEYYHSVEMDIFPLLDYLRTDEIKQLCKWLNNTYDKMNKDSIIKDGIGTNNIGIEYLLAVKSYLSDITTRTETAYTK